MKKINLNALSATAILLVFTLMAMASGSNNDSGSGNTGNESTSAAVSQNSENDSSEEATTTTTETTEETQDLSNGFGTTITFDDLEITFGDTYNWTTVDNQFADYYGADIIELPIHITNIGNENKSLNIFYVKVFGSNGTELDEQGAYFDDLGLFYAGELRPGAEKDIALYIPYDGDGTYYVNFDNFRTEIEVGFEIQK